MASFAPGVRLGPYEIISPLGTGGMGEVWKARDTRVNRIVAIKSSQEQFSVRFEREARAIAALNHPNICSLYDIGPDYLVMEWIDGVPISPPHNIRKLLDLAVQVADGLSAAHAADIIHRDLKPANVLVTREGRVKILDFGLAKNCGAALAEDVTQAAGATNPGMVMGTMSYMSPEQAASSPAIASIAIYLRTRDRSALCSGSRRSACAETCNARNPSQRCSSPDDLTPHFEVRQIEGSWNSRCQEDG
jgi:eukaryotic-like serine/threonine-protein kinase